MLPPSLRATTCHVHLVDLPKVVVPKPLTDGLLRQGLQDRQPEPLFVLLTFDNDDLIRSDRGDQIIYTLSILGADPNQPGLLMLGVENVLPAGVPALPFRLDGMGMTGYVIGLDPLLTLPFTASGSGSMTFKVPMQYTLANDSDVVHAEVLHTNQTIPTGLATTSTDDQYHVHGAWWRRTRELRLQRHDRRT